MVQRIGVYELTICGEAGIVDVVDMVAGDPVTGFTQRFEVRCAS